MNKGSKKSSKMSKMRNAFEEVGSHCGSQILIELKFKAEN